jgi:adenine C2-methylase RlmN of 23S rRNA A2503 and tRNA A37
MEVFTNEDNNVTKFIHTDTSETTIKTVMSCVNYEDNTNIKMRYENRNKYSVFVSPTVGCFMKCSFCYLTIKNCKYKILSQNDILNNLKEAVIYEINKKPELKSKYIKLCWMGMGEVINDSYMMKEITTDFLDWVFENKYAIGLDGVDLSTVLPNIRDEWISPFKEMNNTLSKYEKNPNNKMVVNSSGKTSLGIQYTNRSMFRLFYSLHSTIQETRDKIIPNAMNIESAIEKLKIYSGEFNDNNLIIHHMFFDSINDSEEEVNNLISLLSGTGIELRILRMNYCDNSPYQESKKFEDIITKLNNSLNYLKVQISAGDEIKAACGQFIVKQ